MQTDRQMLYRRALEALRNGVPNRHAVSVLGCHQPEAEEAFSERLASVRSAAQLGKQVAGLLVEGGFGAGKSHLLDYLEHAAGSKNFVTSRIAISKETPLFDPSKVLLAAIDGAAAPGLKGEAIREIALRLQPGTPEYREFFDWAHGPSSGLSQVFAATILLHEKLNNDPEMVDEIANFWSGERLAVSRIRQGLKQINCSEVYSLKPVKIKELAVQRFLFASRMILTAGYAGWILLIDEVELVGRYSLLQRGRSYAELARWMGKVKSATIPGLMAVAAITDDFGLAVLQEKSDRDTVGARLRAKGSDEYLNLAARADTGMRLIEREALTLQPPDDLVLGHTYGRLQEIHGEAYGWDPPEIPWAAASVTRQMRSYVRRWVNEWDLRRLYPGAEISTSEELEIGPTYEQDESLEQPSEDAEGGL